MDFARKQLEKYGWTDGKGLGKHENGISEALKPKLKRSVTGVGHDAASEFNEHWWSALYDKAAKNVEVEEKNGKTKRIKTKDADGVTISSSTWRINKKPSKKTEEEQYAEYFVRTAILSNDGSRTEIVKSESESETEEVKRDVFKMTDEELFAACEGRTAHKGARHGLKAVGKLARIEEQEKKLLLQSKYEGYSHAKKLRQQNEENVVEEMTITNDEIIEPKKKKKKRKRCTSQNGGNTVAEYEQTTPEIIEELKNKMDVDVASDKNEADICVSDKKAKKKKKRKHEVEEVVEDVEVLVESKKKKKKKKKDEL